MLGVINADASTPIKEQIKLARKEGITYLPGQQFPNEEVQASLSSLEHSATIIHTVTTTTSSKPTSTSSSAAASHGGGSSLSTGAVAGIAVGAAIVALGLAALFFLMCRTRTLQKKLDRQSGPAPAPSAWIEPASPQAPAWSGGQVYSPTRQSNALPPYLPYHHLERPDPNKPAGVESWHAGSPEGNNMTPMQSPYSSGGHYR